MSDKDAREEAEIPIRRFEVDICDACVKLEGSECHTPGCRFFLFGMVEVGEYLNRLLIRPIIDGVRISEVLCEILAAESQRTPPKIYKFPEAPESCPECDGTSFITAGGDNLICQVCFLSDKNDELEERIKQLESQRTQAPSETRTKLLKIVAKVARREYMPSLENCRTISDARIEVRRMDDLHAQLAWELKTVLDALAGTQAQAAQPKGEK